MRKTSSICRGSLLRLALEKKKPLTGDQEIEKRNGEIDKARKQLLFPAGQYSGGRKSPRYILERRECAKTY